LSRSRTGVDTEALARQEASPSIGSMGLPLEEQSKNLRMQLIYKSSGNFHCPLTFDIYVQAAIHRNPK
jgi:hypothetical protein